MGNTVTDKEPDYKLLYEQSQKALGKEREAAKKEREKSRLALTGKDCKITELSFQLDKLRRFLFGQKNEKLKTLNVDVCQLHLFELGTPEEEQEALSKKATPPPTDDENEEKKRKKGRKGTGRMPLPEHLRRVDIVIEPAEDTTGLVKIGQEVTEVLDIVPAEFVVLRYIRPKYAKPDGGGILAGCLPERLVDKGVPSERLIAQMTVDKYVFGLPLHRIIAKYSRFGVRIPASTASDWIMKGWKHLAPLWELPKLLTANQKYLQADETPIKVQDRDKKNNMHKGYMWAYHAPCGRLVCFDYQKGRDSGAPKEMLQGFKGILQTDGYGAYESLYGNHKDVTLVYCMAHARRYFVDALKYDRAKSSFVLEKIKLLYKLEQEMREQGLDWGQRTAERQLKAKPVLEELHEWMKQQWPTTPPCSPLGKAIKYALGRA